MSFKRPFRRKYGHFVEEPPRSLKTPRMMPEQRSLFHFFVFVQLVDTKKYENPTFPFYSIASRIPPGRLISVVCLVACWFVVFASVCMFFRSWNLLAHSSGACLGGLLGFILGARGGAWAPFWVCGLLLGSILGVWGCLGLLF